MSLKCNIFLKPRASLSKHFLSVLLFKTVMVEFVEVFYICFILFDLILFCPQYINTKQSGLLLRFFGVIFLTVARVFLVVARW